MHKRGDTHRRHPGNQDKDTRHRGLSQRRRDGNVHHHYPSELFRPLRDPHEPCTLRKRLVAHMVLNRMPDFGGGNGDSVERFPTEFIGRQTDSFGLRIVMVPQLGRFHLKGWPGSILAAPIDRIPPMLFHPLYLPR